MSDWREHVLRSFVDKASRFILVSDPDGLMQDEKVNAKLRERGFEVVHFKDSISFRYLYESNYRKRWDEGEKVFLVVIIKASRSELSTILPYDIYKAGVQPGFHFSLSKIFPKLSYPIISKLIPNHLDRLYQAYLIYQGGQLGDIATKKFVLSRVFRIDPDSLTSLPDLFFSLLQFHCSPTTMPEVFSSYLIECLRKNSIYEELPLEKIVPSSSTFFKFLQEQWKQFIQGCIDGVNLSKVPFEHESIRLFINNLFIEKHLKPIQFPKPDILPLWTHIGIEGTFPQSKNQILENILNRLKTIIPLESSTFSEWQQFAALWAEAIVQKVIVGKGIIRKLEEHFEKLHDLIEERFAGWMIKNHPALYSLRLRHPVTVSHIGDYLLAEIKHNATRRKIALLVLDGLSLDQWLVLGDCIEKRRPGVFEFDDKTIFAAVPSITSVSRQAVFAGQEPLYFEDTLLRTDKDEERWKTFWENEGYEAGYMRGLMLVDEREVEHVINTLTQPVIGLVVNFIDETMRGVTLGTAEIHYNLRLWVEKYFLIELIEELFERSFDVYITSDHGNIETYGMGTLRQGSLVEKASTRVRVYENPVFAKQALEIYTDSVQWPVENVRSQYCFIFAGGRKAFLRKSKVKQVSHGGISLEEIVVPFIRVWRKK